jgi:hypothetical protein
MRILKSVALDSTEVELDRAPPMSLIPVYPTPEALFVKLYSAKLEVSAHAGRI